jgi:diguanylate cyclase (GGDEF)-like protein
MAFVVIALAAIGLSDGHYDIWMPTAPYASLISGLALIHIGTCQFRTGHARLLTAALLWGAAMVGTTLPFLLGFSGIGTIALNLACAIYMFLAGRQYWIGRTEAPIPLVAGAFLFALTGISFVCCAIVLALNGQWMLFAPPSNWAEEFNSIMAIVGLTGIGALSLTLNQSRATKRHRLEAQTDSLTGLLNRRALFDRFGKAELPLGTAVLMFDIDHFKQINDRQGHAAGDAVIRHLAAILHENLRDEDSVARIGGEEFCAVLRPMPVDHAKAVAERIRADFDATPVRLIAETVRATVSVGVATSGADESFSSVLHRADAALYKAKDNGRNRVTAASMRLIA